MQAVTRVLAIRHGETDWNRDTRIQGQLDIGLNETGRWQARRLALALADEDLSAVCSSDLARAIDTARELAHPRRLQVITDRGLRERGFGTFEGSTFIEIEARWPLDAARWRRRDLQFAPGGGETLVDLNARCIGAATLLAQAHAGQSIAIVAHGGVLDCLYRAAAHVELDAPRSWEVPNAGINRLLYTPQGFTLVGWGDVGHLEGHATETSVVET
ncbi:MAG: histidine phosphatase family protein [Burkholderiaceae bacterium]